MSVGPLIAVGEWHHLIFLRDFNFKRILKRRTHVDNRLLNQCSYLLQCVFVLSNGNDYSIQGLILKISMKRSHSNTCFIGFVSVSWICFIYILPHNFIDLEKIHIRLLGNHFNKEPEVNIVPKYTVLHNYEDCWQQSDQIKSPLYCYRILLIYQRFLAHLCWNLKWAFLITRWTLSVRLCVCLYFFHFFIFFSRTTGPVSTKLGTKHS